MKYPPRSTGLVRPVFGIDIDGTLGFYHQHFLHFASGWLGKRLDDRLYDGSVPLHTWMGVSKTTYRQVKLAYRRGGLKRSMPVDPQAASLVRVLRDTGALVVICTTRPYLQLENIEPDTREWLRRNGIQHDGIISGEHKYRTLASMYGKDRVVGVLDDLPALCAQAEGLGVPWVRIVRPHNGRDTWIGEKGCLVSNLWMAAEILGKQLDEWEARQ